MLMDLFVGLRIANGVVPVEQKKPAHYYWRLRNEPGRHCGSF